MRSVFQMGGLIGAICCAIHLLSVPTLAAERPNVVLIISDDQTYSDFGFWPRKVIAVFRLANTGKVIGELTPALWREGE